MVPLPPQQRGYITDALRKAGKRSIAFPRLDQSKAAKFALDRIEITMTVAVFDHTGHVRDLVYLLEAGQHRKRRGECCDPWPPFQAIEQLKARRARIRQRNYAAATVIDPFNEARPVAGGEVADEVPRRRFVRGEDEGLATHA